MTEIIDDDFGLCNFSQAYQISKLTNKQSYKIENKKPRINQPSKRKSMLAACRNRKDSGYKERELVINISDKQMGDNKMITHRFENWRLVPLSIYRQMSKAHNLYFLFICILQTMDTYTTTSNIPYQLFPLLLLLLVNILIDSYEDSQRKTRDFKENLKLFNKWSVDNNEFIYVESQDLQLGDVIKVDKESVFPADLLLLSTSDPSAECLVDQSKLDGHNYYKTKQTDTQLQDIFADTGCTNEKLIKVRYDLPTDILQSFGGYVLLDGEKIQIDMGHLLLRGSRLKEGSWVIGLVVYKGRETKEMLQYEGFRLKGSQINTRLKAMLQNMMVLQVIGSVLSAMASVAWFSSNRSSVEGYLVINQIEYFSQFFQQVLIHQMVYLHLLPISALIYLDLVRLIQARNIQKDSLLPSAEVHQSALNEELGQVQYIFSDKTGTLTKNYMEFRKVTINGKIYGNRIDSKYNGKQYKHVNFQDSLLMADMQTADIKHKQMIINCLFIIAVCNSIKVREDDDGELEYFGSSPDELALANFARSMGLEYTGIDEEQTQYITFQGNPVKFKVLHVLHFNSARKRMSVIIQDINDNIILYCKGADSVIFERLNEKSQSIIEQTREDLDGFGREGLRTLVMAQKVIEREEYLVWKSKLLNKQGYGGKKDFRLNEIYEFIEVDMQLVGGTGIHDQLQEGVGDVMESFRSAGIHVWVLTGDKMETSVNVAFNAGVIEQGTTIIAIEKIDHRLIGQQLFEIQQQMRLLRKYALVISGYCLFHIEKKQDLITQFIRVCQRAQCVVACRVSGQQKQQIIKMIMQNRKNVVTLAVGDGSNDASMLREANVGVAIKGQNDNHSNHLASTAADYTLTEFRFLSRLLFEIGRESYRKNTYLIFFNFYKMFLVVFPNISTMWYNGSSGQQIFFEGDMVAYSLFFSQFPLVLFSLHDQQYPDQLTHNNPVKQKSHLENRPIHYQLGLKNQLFNSTNFLKWLMLGLSHSFMLILTLHHGFVDVISQEGYPIFWESLSLGCMSINLTVNSVILAQIANVYSVFFIISILLCHATSMAILLICNDNPESPFYNNLNRSNLTQFIMVYIFNTSFCILTF